MLRVGLWVGPKETAIWAKAIGRGHLCTLDIMYVCCFSFSKFISLCQTEIHPDSCYKIEN